MSKSREDFKKQLANLHGGGYTIDLGTVDGDYAFGAPGLYPKRKYPYVQGKWIKKGWLKENDWMGYENIEQIPFHMNSKKGFYANANNKVTADGALSDAGTGMAGSTRADRLHKEIAKMIASGKKITQKDMMNLQLDQVDETAQENLSLIYKIYLSNEQEFEKMVREHAEKEH